MKNTVLQNGMVVSLASTNKEEKAIKKVNERKDRRGVELFVLSNIIMDYFNHSVNEEYIYSHSDKDMDGTLRKKVQGECLSEYVYLYKSIPHDIVLIANAILDGKIRKASMLVKKSGLHINLSTLLDNKLVTQFNNWDISIYMLNERYAY